ncbi:MAG: sigma-54-dependent Fis family transcriptional regulator [Candidatus Margulisbacteria bacterium]|nr:sigma-54-dependent Fis family transcriptional regulator [Candidatus Margulisiibacteriota bacterium]
MLENCVVIIDDEESLVKSIIRLLSDENLIFETASNGKQGLKKCIEHSPELVIVDYQMPEMDGLEFIKALKSIQSDVPVIVMTAHGDREVGIQFLKEGAFRYLEKPFKGDEFRLTVIEAIKQSKLLKENKTLSTIINLKDDFSEIIGESSAMKELFDVIHKVAATEATVLIQGESGTGKELIAKAIHEKSDRCSGPFIRFNCAALPETLIESELFGHEKGAFTGAEQLKLGRFELANGGTIFVDEIGELSLKMQVKLLRVLQEREFERVGGTHTLSADIRVIAATNRNLQDMVREGSFREDLFFRLNTFPITIPPLRNRGDDVLLLAESFLQRYSVEHKKKGLHLNEGAMSCLKQYQWTGNIRELQNVVSRAVILSENGQDISKELLIMGELSHSSQLSNYFDQELTEEALMKAYARHVLKKFNGVKKDTAQALGINFRTLNNRLAD